MKKKVKLTDEKAAIVIQRWYRNMKTYETIYHSKTFDENTIYEND